MRDGWWAFMEPPGVNCAVWQLSKHLELPLEEVQADMQRLFQRLHPEETEFFVSPAMCGPHRAYGAF